MINDIEYVAFLKFGKKDNLEKLQQGLLYMKESKYFRDLEYKTGIAGMGDRHDSCVIQRDVPILINGKTVPNPDWISGSYQGDEKTPIFCCTCLKENDFIYSSAKKCYVLKDGLFNYSTLKQEFGEYCLIIPHPEEFIGRINSHCLIQNIDMRFKEVRYVDYGKKDNYWTKYYENDLSHFFIKDKSFSNQKEFRLLLANIYTDTNKDFITLSVPNGFSDFTRIESVEKLDTLELHKK